jgi:nucleoside-diphosphate-sugar epimerase
MASPARPFDYLRYGIETLDVGSIGTRNVLSLTCKYGASYLVASTSECYGDPAVHPQPESYWGHVNPIGVRSVYDEAKRFTEALTMAYHRYRTVDTHIVRIFNTYGPAPAAERWKSDLDAAATGASGGPDDDLRRGNADEELLLCERRDRRDS